MKLIQNRGVSDGWRLDFEAVWAGAKRRATPCAGLERLNFEWPARFGCSQLIAHAGCAFMNRRFSSQRKGISSIRKYGTRLGGRVLNLFSETVPCGSYMGTGLDNEVGFFSRTPVT